MNRFYYSISTTTAYDRAVSLVLFYDLRAIFIRIIIISNVNLTKVSTCFTVSPVTDANNH